MGDRFTEKKEFTKMRKEYVPISAVTMCLI